ncbi:hypothetical protein C8R43DRAFT_641331 [Mycena crocata]|nr:hypothetical protein C8R43DRAFT_641331 [Mycena crocata]
MISTSALFQENSSHPVLSTLIEVSPDVEICKLYLHLTLPPLIFVDPFELANYRDSYSFEHLGSSNLELPLASLNGSGSSLLLNVTVPSGGGSIELFTFSVRLGWPFARISDGGTRVAYCFLIMPQYLCTTFVPAATAAG